MLCTGDLTHFQAGFLHSFMLLMISVIGVQAGTCFVVVAIPSTLTTIPFDLLVPVITFAIWFIQLSYSRQRIYDKLTEYLFDILETTEKVAVYYELFYDSFLKQKDKYHRYLLHIAFIGHNIHCKDPRCLCFLVNEDLETSHGLKCGKHARDMYLSYTASRDFESNALVTFDDENIQKKYFQRHNSVITSRVDPDTLKVCLTTVDRSSKPWLTQLNLTDANKFKLLMCSLYKSFYKWNYQSGELFVLVMSFLRFLLSEYQNKIAVLLFVSEYKNSARYKREASAYKSALLENVARLAHKVGTQGGLGSKPSDKTSLAGQVGLSSNVAVGSLSLVAALQTAKDIQQLLQANRKAIAEKLKLYDMLISNRIPYPQLVKQGSNTRVQLLFLERQIGQLVVSTDNNIKVLREAVIFEICVQERNYISPALQERYKSVILYRKNREIVENDKASHNGALKFSSNNVVLFTQRQPSGFIITQTTDNAGRLLGAKPGNSESRHLTEFLPKEFGQKHDLLMLNYLNGESFCKRNMKIQGMINNLQKESTTSVTVYPKLELGFMSQVQIAALIVEKHRNKNPMIWTNLSGRIIGYNRKATRIFQDFKRMSESSFFLAIPTLLGLYFPKDKLTTSGTKTKPESVKLVDCETEKQSEPHKAHCRRLDSLFTPRGRQKQIRTSSFRSEEPPQKVENTLRSQRTAVVGHVAEPEGKGFLETGHYNHEHTNTGETMFSSTIHLEAFCFGLLPSHRFNLREEAALIDMMREEKFREETQDYNLDTSNRQKPDGSVKIGIGSDVDENTPSNERSSKLYNQDYMVDSTKMVPYPFSSEVHFDSFLSGNRYFISKHLEMATKANLRIETQHYTNYISFREITFSTLSEINEKVRNLLLKFSCPPTINPFSAERGFSQYLPTSANLRSSTMHMLGESSPTREFSPIQELLYEFLMGGNNYNRQNSRTMDSPSEFVEFGFWPFLLRSQPAALHTIFKISQLRANQKLLKDVDKIIRKCSAKVLHSPNKVSTPLSRKKPFSSTSVGVEEQVYLQQLGRGSPPQKVLEPATSLSSQEVITPKFASSELGSPENLAKRTIFKSIYDSPPQNNPLQEQLRSCRGQFLIPMNRVGSVIHEEMEDDDGPDKSSLYNVSKADQSAELHVDRLMREHKANLGEQLPIVEDNKRIRESTDSAKLSQGEMSMSLRGVGIHPVAPPLLQGNFMETPAGSLDHLPRPGQFYENHSMHRFSGEESFAPSHRSENSLAEISFENKVPLGKRRKFFIPNQDSSAENRVGGYGDSSIPKLDDLQGPNTDSFKDVYHCGMKPDTNAEANCSVDCPDFSDLSDIPRFSKAEVTNRGGDAENKGLEHEETHSLMETIGYFFEKKFAPKSMSGVSEIKQPPQGQSRLSIPWMQAEDNTPKLPPGAKETTPDHGSLERLQRLKDKCRENIFKLKNEVDILKLEFEDKDFEWMRIERIAEVYSEKLLDSFHDMLSSSLLVQSEQASRTTNYFWSAPQFASPTTSEFTSRPKLELNRVMESLNGGGSQDEAPNIQVPGSDGSSVLSSGDENCSSILRTSIKSDPSLQETGLVRILIERNILGLGIQKWRFAIGFMSIVVAVLKVSFTSNFESFHSKIISGQSDMYTATEFVAITGFLFKESQKHEHIKSDLDSSPIGLPPENLLQLEYMSKQLSRNLGTVLTQDLTSPSPFRQRADEITNTRSPFELLYLLRELILNYAKKELFVKERSQELWASVGRLTMSILASYKDSIRPMRDKIDSDFREIVYYILLNFSANLLVITVSPIMVVYVLKKLDDYIIRVSSCFLKVGKNVLVKSVESILKNCLLLKVSLAGKDKLSASMHGESSDSAVIELGNYNKFYDFSGTSFGRTGRSAGSPMKATVSQQMFRPGQPTTRSDDDREAVESQELRSVGMKSYTTYKNFPKSNHLLRYFLILGAILLMNIPSAYQAINIAVNYSQLRNELEAAANLSFGSASTFLEAAIAYSQLKREGQTIQISNSLVAFSTDLSRMFDFQQNQDNLNLLTLSRGTPTCQCSLATLKLIFRVNITSGWALASACSSGLQLDYSLARVPSSTVFKTCLTSLDNSSDMTHLQGIHQLKQNLQDLQVEVTVAKANRNISHWTNYSYFDTSSFKSSESLLFFHHVSTSYVLWKNLANNEEANSTSSEQTYIVLTVFLILLLLQTAVIIWLVVPAVSVRWTVLRDTLLVSSPSVLRSTYVKSCFSPL